jgi:hypothetical protein
MFKSICFFCFKTFASESINRAIVFLVKNLLIYNRTAIARFNFKRKVLYC